MWRRGSTDAAINQEAIDDDADLEEICKNVLQVGGLESTEPGADIRCKAARANEASLTGGGLARAEVRWDRRMGCSRRQAAV